jgi:hypothetical protein
MHHSLSGFPDVCFWPTQVLGRLFLFIYNRSIINYMEHNTAKHFVLQLGSLASLYLSLGFLLVLVFGIINLRFPDPAEGYWALESAASGVRIGIAMVVVFFPTYLILTRIVNRLRRTGTSDTYLTLTKWLIYLSLLIGGGILLGDLVAVIIGFLEGELTVRFLLKALAVFVVTGAAFYYYILDARGYWLTHEQQSVWFGIGASIVVASALIMGVYHIEAPAEVRERKLDEKQITDLQNIQWTIVGYYTREGTLPPTLEIAFAPGMTIPIAPEDRPSYRYTTTEDGFSLCATFSHASAIDAFARPFFEDQTQPFRGLENWEHGTGEYCFERITNTQPS